jgi:hypothetical protein
MASNPLQLKQHELKATYLAAAVAFAQVDVAHAPDATLASLSRLVVRFLQRDMKAQPSRPFDREELATIQQRSLNLLYDLTIGPEDSFHVVQGLQLSFMAERHRAGRVTFAVHGEPVDVYLYQLVQLLRDVGVDRLALCPAHLPRSTKRCGRLFVKVTKKHFCSARCQSRAYMTQKRDRERRERIAFEKQEQAQREKREQLRRRRS